METYPLIKNPKSNCSICGHSLIPKRQEYRYATFYPCSNCYKFYKKTHKKSCCSIL